MKRASYLKKIWFQALLVFALAVLQYANTRNHEYAWDDAIVLTENSRVQKGLADIPELFENIKSDETQNRYGYRPISLLSFATDVEFFGMNPKAAHKVNILLYGILCVLVLIFLQNFFPSSGWRNFLITALFVVHPLHTEVVANIKSRDEILAMIFGLAALLFYHKAVKLGPTASNKPLASIIGKYSTKSLLFGFGFIRFVRDVFKSRPILYFPLSAFLIILAFHSKESAITFCGIAFLIPWFVNKESDWKSNLKNATPAFIILAALLLIRMFVYSDLFFQSNDFELYTKGLFHNDGFIGNPLTDTGLGGRIAMAFFLIPYFLYRFLVPYPLVHDYSYNQFEVLGFSDWQIWVAIPISVAFITCGVKGLLNKKTYGFGIVFFLITSSIYFHIVQIAPDIFAERYLFVPSLGILIILLWLYDYIAKPRFMNLIIAVVMIPMMIYSWKRNEVWKDNKTLLESDLPYLTNCVRTNYNYALFLHREYYNVPEDEKIEMKQKVLKYYEHTMSLTDRLFNVYLDLGAAYMEFGEPKKAHEIFLRASEKYKDLSAPFVQLGKYHMSFKEYDKAIPYFQQALKNGAKNSDYHYLLSICLFNTGAHDEAIAILLEGEKLGVSSSAYHSLVARLYVKLNRREDAIEALKRGLLLYPNDKGLMFELDKIAEDN